MFGQLTPPALPYAEEDLEALAKEVLQSQVVLTGVQAKLSLHLTGNTKNDNERRFTIVGRWGGYISKPPTGLYPQLPEVEDLTMNLARITKIKTVPHSLIRLKSRNLAYITKRIDRTRKGKLAMVDMCQLTERQTEDKYRGSYEQIGKTIDKFSATPGLDLVDFFELVIFSFLTGNADMHLKNFSLLEQSGVGITLSPAYDLLNTAFVNPSDLEELALTLNGKKRRIKKQDFAVAMNTLKLTEKQQENIFSKMVKSMPKWEEAIECSFLSPAFKESYKSIITERMNGWK